MRNRRIALGCFVSGPDKTSDRRFLFLLRVHLSALVQYYMSPITLQVVQDSPSGYLMSSGVLDLFWSPLKSRGEGDGKKHNDRCTKSDSNGCSSTEDGNQPSTSDSEEPQSMSSTSSESAQSFQGSSASCSTTITPSTSTTVDTSATGSRPMSTARASTSPLSTSSSSPIESSSPSTGLSTQPKSHSNKGAIIGGVVGGVVILSIAALILFMFLRRRRRMKHTAPSAEFLHPNSPFQRLNTARSGSPTRTRSVFDMLPSPNSGDVGRKSLLRSLSRRDYKAPPTLDKATVHTTSAVHAL
ncbi:hypothetical protein ARMGADRAFT_695177 [Armillaria gallica]|uniref:Mid2 domain-containing protein n=1 Tax=Armillaria gallica TaxID=47427 RepID=A0A2H3E4Y3_ARMGA|nr:hypothetical protein ARMGADRAFT_695177 [Armillaria gallica]